MISQQSRTMFSVAVLAIFFPGTTVNGRQDDSDKTEWQRFQESDLPKKIADLKPAETVADEDNAAWWLAKADEGRLAIDTRLADHFFLSDCTNEIIQEYNEVVAEHPETIGNLLKAAAAPDYHPLRDFDVDTFAAFDSQVDANDFRSVTRVLMYRAGVELAQGRTDSAVESALAILKLSRHDATEFGLEGHLIRTTVSMMGLASLNQIVQSANNLTPETLQLIRDELERHDTLDDFQTCFDSERVLGVQLLRDQGLVSAIRIEEYLKIVRLCQERSNKSLAEQARLLDVSDGVDMTMLGMIYPTIQMSRGVANKKLTLVRCLRLLIELNLQMNEQPALEDIHLPKSAVTDPISGNPLVFRKLDNGWLVYGVGRNNTDDGGDVDLDHDYGFTSVAFKK